MLGISGIQQTLEVLVQLLIAPDGHDVPEIAQSSVTRERNTASDDVFHPDPYPIISSGTSKHRHLERRSFSQLSILEQFLSCRSKIILTFLVKLNKTLLLRFADSIINAPKVHSTNT